MSKSALAGSSTEVDCLFGLLVALTFGALLFLVMLAGTGPTEDEQARLLDQMPTATTRTTGITWR